MRIQRELPGRLNADRTITPTDPIIEKFYQKGYADAKAGKRSRVCYMYKLAYVSGRYDAVSGRSSRYEAKP